jgi:hypothetical protein
VDGAVGAGARAGVGVAAGGADEEPPGTGGEYPRAPTGCTGFGVAAGRGKLRTWLRESIAVVVVGVGDGDGDAGA